MCHREYHYFRIDNFEDDVKGKSQESAPFDAIGFRGLQFRELAGIIFDTSQGTFQVV
jgi:hypothetical protein